MDNVQVIFGSSFPKDQEYTQVNRHTQVNGEDFVNKWYFDSVVMETGMTSLDLLLVLICSSNFLS